MKWILNLTLFLRHPLDFMQLRKENHILWKQLRRMETRIKSLEFERKFHPNERELFYKKLFDDSTDAIIIISFEGLILNLNHGICEMLHYTAEELMDNHISMLKPTWAKFNMDIVLKQVVIQGHLRFETRLQRKDGGIVDVELNATVIDSEQPVILGIARDISDQKKLKFKLDESASNLHALLNAIPDPTYLIDIEGNLLIANNQLYKTAFLEKKVSEGMNLFQSLSEFHAQFFKNKIQTVLTTGKMVEYEEFEDGKWYNYRILPIANKQNEIQFLAILGTDITTQKKNREQMNKLAAAVEQSANVIVITNKLGDIEYVNKKFTETTGYTLKEAVGKNPRILKSGIQSNEVYDDLWNTIVNGNSWKGEFCNRSKTGEIFWETTLITPIKNDSGEITHFLSIKEDITRQKENEAIMERQRKELEESEQRFRELNATKDKFFSIIAHDLKSPFNTLIGFSNLLLDNSDTLTEDKKMEFIRHIHKASEQGFQLLANLLDWARTQTNKIAWKPENIDINRIIRDVLDLLGPNAQNKSIKLLSQTEISPFAFADEDMINTVVRNLVANAIKFTHEGGQVSVNLSEENNHIKISVIDTGVGIPPENIDKLFSIDENPTTLGTSHEKGTGLGLILCKEFVEKNGGQIWVESTLHEGSKFHFTLPRQQKQPL